MSREEDPKEDRREVSKLEAALAALVPRAEGLNRDRLMFLAGRASVEPKIGEPAVGQIANLPHVVARPRRLAGWAWPTAFATMSGIAALLLVALAIRPAPQVTERIVERFVTAPQEPIADVVRARIEPASIVHFPAMVAALPDWLAWGLFPQPDCSAGHEPSYAELRKQVLTYGLEPWQLQASASAGTGNSEEEASSSREQLNHWLKAEGVEGAARRLSTPNPRNPLGAKS